MKSIDSFLESVKTKFPLKSFTDGECHTLAAVICEKFNCKLVAIIRTEIRQGGDVLWEGYSHMVAEINNQCYDLDGDKADERWLDLWSNEYDEDGIMSEFDFLEISRDELEQFLSKYRCTIDSELYKSLISLD